jgi:phosphoribosylanthranilate isomerase
MTIPRIKICCMQSTDEAAMAVRYGASALGLVSEMPSGPGPIPESLIAKIASTVPPGVSTFLLTALTDVGEIIKQQRRCRTDTVQLTDRLRSGTLADLRAALPGIRIVQVIHVNGEEAIQEAREVTREVHAILLDSGNPDLPVRELGGTGRIHNWEISRRIRDSIEIPVFLAGGLQSSNVSDAIRVVQPFGVDLCSGVRTNDRLDERKLAAFFDAVTSGTTR